MYTLYTTDERIVHDAFVRALDEATYLLNGNSLRGLSSLTYRFEIPTLGSPGLRLRINTALDAYLGRFAGPQRYKFELEHEDGHEWALTVSRRPKSPRFIRR